MLVLGSLIGIIVVIVAFRFESRDTGLRNIAEIEAITQLPSLAIVPRTERSAKQNERHATPRRNFAVLSSPRSQFAESLRSLRTSLLLSSTGKPPKYILFTSSTASQGKTTIAGNMACALAQGDTRVLLIDGDLRRPSVHSRIGLSTVLAGTTPFEQSLQHVPEAPNLDILASGPVPPFPAELLSSEAMRRLLLQAGERYDFVVLDSPPILSVADGVILARSADAVLLVVRQGKSSTRAVRRARDLLLRAGIPVTGIVVNAVDHSSPEYQSDYSKSSTKTLEL